MKRRPKPQKKKACREPGPGTRSTCTWANMFFSSRKIRSGRRSSLFSGFPLPVCCEAPVETVPKHCDCDTSEEVHRHHDRVPDVPVYFPCCFHGVLLIGIMNASFDTLMPLLMQSVFVFSRTRFNPVRSLSTIPISSLYCSSLKPDKRNTVKIISLSFSGFANTRIGTYT